MSKELCNKTKKECGYLNFTNDVLDLMKKHNIKDVLTLETTLKEYELMKQTKFIVVDKKISDDDLEKLKNQRMFVTDLTQCEIKPLFDEETQKKLKVLEILKEKVDELEFLRNYIRSGFDVKQYNETISSMHGDFLTQEEYDLLKEVLL